MKIKNISFGSAQLHALSLFKTACTNGISRFYFP